MRFGSIIFVAFGLAISACTSTPSPSPSPAPINVVGCNAETLLTDGISSAIAGLDSCTNLSVMESDIQALWGPANLCKMLASEKSALQGRKEYRMKRKFTPLKATDGAISSIICPYVVSTIDNYLNTTSVAVKWGCSGSTDVDHVVSAACSLIPF